MNPLLITDVQANPDCISAQITTPAGLALAFRPLVATDAEALGKYFLGLSETTKALYGPHPFDQVTADRLCAEIDYARAIRMVGELPGGEIIAYFILEWGVPEHEVLRYAQAGVVIDPKIACQIAPSVADAYQSQGIGSPLMQHIFQVAQALGRKQLILMEGVFAHNERGVHFYRKAGFQMVGIFVPTWSAGRDCYDMYVEL